ncbi:MAG: hypothetical protein GX090_05345 [Firmicutes bacterium]|nr:hypothetical protein [Bacillota bacterium]HOB34670.1 hypothetical protein [Bacillota bacterium]HPZ89907.1 hypothetical protein [Bacillota bacterium]HQE01313.1 hypothetical protein [Bacillota bacterium]
MRPGRRLRWAGAAAVVLGLVLSVARAQDGRIALVGEEDGTIRISAEALVPAVNVAPGDRGGARVDIENRGSRRLPVYMSWEIYTASEGLDREVLLEIEDWQGRKVYAGSLADAEPVFLGEVPPGETRCFAVQHALAETAGDALQGAALSFSYLFFSGGAGEFPVTGTNIMVLVPLGLALAALGGALLALAGKKSGV